MNIIFNKIGSALIGLLIATHILSPVQAPQPAVAPQAPQQLGAFNVSGGGTYYLKGSVGSSDTSVTLSSFKEPISNTPYTMGYLNTSIAYGTLEPQTPSRTEFISFTGVTQGSDGSAVLTGVTRGLTRSPAGQSCTASTTLASRHPGQGIFILSDSPCLFAEYAVKRNDESISGAWTIGEPTAAAGIATKNYVDTHVNGGAVSTDNVTVAGTAGESFNQGQIIYFNTFDGKWYKASASNASTSENQIFGIANGGGTNGVNVVNGVLLHGVSTSTQGTGMTQGQKLYLGNTAGATSTSPGSFFRSLGAARSTSVFYFDPHIDVSTTTNATTTNFYVSGTCDGCVHTTINDFTSSGLWSKPLNGSGGSSISHVMVIAVGAGGSGGGGCACTGGLGGAGGGGGAVRIQYLDASKLPSRVWVQVGTTTAPGAATTATNGGNGTPSFFGTSTSAFYVYAGGGGGGYGGNGKTGVNFTLFGGAGGSWFGNTALATSSPLGASSTAYALSGQGPEGTITGRPAEWGGGSGGGLASSTALSNGGCSLNAAGGGGGTASPTGSGDVGGNGGGSGCYSIGLGGAGSASPSAATAGSSASTTGQTYGGNGGGGGGSASNGTDNGGTGGNGGYPGGGGGGGGSCQGGACVGGAGGRGAPGWVRVISW